MIPINQPRRTDRGSRLDRHRRGYSLLEVQVAFALLGIGLASLAPLVVMQLRQVRALENRLQGQVQRYDSKTGAYSTIWQSQYDPNSGTWVLTQPTIQNYYLVPWSKPWEQKLFGAAQIVISNQLPGTATNPCEPGPLQGQQNQSPQNEVSITCATYDGHTATATVVLGPS